MSESAQLEIRLLPDHPTTKDEFKSGAHEKIAETLVDIVTEGEGGKAIGLEGSWGSGKSSVIEIAAQKFQEHNAETQKLRHFVFVFDAWAHQGDPTRRVFLDNLIKRLIDSSIVDPRKWENKLEDFRSRRKTTVEKKFEKLSGFGKVVVFVIYLLPIAYMLLATIGSASPHTIKSVPVYWIGGAIIATPYFLAFFAWISHWKIIEESLGEKQLRWRDSFTGKGGLHVFNRQTDEIKTEQLVREEEATTIEFNALFDELLKDASDRKHRLIIVLDNLDRLPKDQIRDTWAMMRNFFVATFGSSRQPILKNVWLIVPFDRDHIESVFEPDKPESHLNAAPGFIEKTFEIVLRVPPPLLSNWQEFLRANMWRALGSHIKIEEIHRATKLLDLDRSEQRKWITPREIKSFVNSIAAQVKQWGDKIPLHHQALYVLKRHKLAFGVDSLKDASLLDDRTRSYVNDWDKEWVKYLAAAHYNVSPDLALEVLLSDDIVSAFRQTHDATLKALQSINGFENVLFRLIEDECISWSDEEPQLLLNAATQLDQLEFHGQNAVNEVWQRVIAAATQIEKPIDRLQGAEAGIRALIRRSGPRWKLLIGSIIRAVTRTDTFDAANPPLEAGDRVYSLLAAAMDESSKSQSDEALGSVFREIRLPDSAPFITGVARSAASGSPVFSAFALGESMNASLDKYLSDLVGTEPEEWLVTTVREMNLRPNTTGFTNFVSAIETRARTNTPKTTPEIGAVLLKLLHTLRAKVPSAKKAAEKLSQDGSIHGLLEIGRSQNSTELIASCLRHLMIDRLETLEHPSNHPTYGDFNNINEYIRTLQTNPSDLALVERIAEIMEGPEPFPEILEESTSSSPKNELLRAVARKAIELHTFNFVPSELIITNFEDVHHVLGDELSDRFLRQIEAYNLSARYSGAEAERVSAEFLSRTKRLQTKQFKKVSSAVVARLESLEHPVWLDHLKNESHVLTLLFLLKELGETLNLDAAFSDALLAHVQSLFEGGPIPQTFGDQWHQLPKFMSTSRQEVFYKNVRDKLLNAAPNSNLIKQVIDLFGEQLFMDADFESRANDSIRVVIEPLLAEASEESISLVGKYSSHFAPIVKKSSKESRDSLTSRLIEMSRRDQTKDSFATLAKQLGVRFSKGDDELNRENEPKSEHGE
jgi:hypothetical protein